MRIVGNILLILGLVSVVWGAARWRTIDEVTSKSVRAFDDFARSPHTASANTNEVSGEWPSQPELRRLRLRLSMVGGLYNGQPDFIIFGALGLILMVIGYYFVQRKECPNSSTTMRRWNEQTGRYEPFSPGMRKYPSLSEQLRAELGRVPPVSDGMMEYHPCKVRLMDGRWQDFVYVVDADDYIRVWGVWPDQDKGKREVRIEDVEEIAESSYRLPPVFAQRLYEAGESGMGYMLFELCYRDGSRSAHMSGNAVDFIRFPDGKTPADIMSVHPHSGRETVDHLSAQEYYWCIYDKA